MKYLLLSIAAALTLSSPAVFAHEAPLGTLEGDGIAIHYANHATSGELGGILFFASPAPGSMMKMTYRLGEATHTSALVSDGKGGFRATYTDSKGKELALKMESSGIQKDRISGRVGENDFQLQFSAASMRGHHFVNPEFTLTVGNQTWDFAMKNGELCLGCIVKMTHVLVGLLSL